MITKQQHINRLGSYLYQGNENGSTHGPSHSSSRQPTTTTTTRTFAEAKAADDWGLFIVPFSQSAFGIVLTDGVSNWNIVMTGNETVEDALHNFLTKYYKYSLLPQQNENGTYAADTYGSRSGRNGTSSISTTSRSRAGSYGTSSIRGVNGLLSNLVKSVKSALDLESDAEWEAKFDAEYDATNYRMNADSADYNAAMNNHLLRTLSEVLLSNNVVARHFYIPADYYYIGRDLETSPYYDMDTSISAKTQGDEGTRILIEKEVDDWIDKTNDEPITTPQPKQLTKKQKILYALMAISTVLFFAMPDGTKKRKRR